MDEATIQKAIELYNSGLTVQKTADALGKGKATIFQALKKRNVKMRKTGNSRDTLDHNFFEVLDTDPKAYFAGFLLADGSIRETNASPRIRLLLQKRDRHILESLKVVVNTRNEVHESPVNCYIQFSSRKMAEDLNRYSIFPRKTKRKKFLIHNVPEEFHGAFIRGFFDGNGWISRKKPTSWLVGFGDGETFLEQLRDYLCERLGVFHLKVNTHGGSNLMHWSAKQDVCKLLHFMYQGATYYLFRKHEKVLTCIRELEGEDAIL